MLVVGKQWKMIDFEDGVALALVLCLTLPSSERSLIQMPIPRSFLSRIRIEIYAYNLIQCSFHDN
jgi:hypothetical protein